MTKILFRNWGATQISVHDSKCGKTIVSAMFSAMELHCRNGFGNGFGNGIPLSKCVGNENSIAEKVSAMVSAMKFHCRNGFGNGFGNDIPLPKWFRQ